MRWCVLVFSRVGCLVVFCCFGTLRARSGHPLLPPACSHPVSQPGEATHPCWPFRPVVVGRAHCCQPCLGCWFVVGAQGGHRCDQVGSGVLWGHPTGRGNGHAHFFSSRVSVVRAWRGSPGPGARDHATGADPPAGPGVDAPVGRKAGGVALAQSQRARPRVGPSYG